MSHAGGFKAKPSSLKSHTGQHAVCVCVCEDSLVTTSYSLCVASSASFTLLPLLQLPFCTYMSSCFRKTIQQSAFALTQGRLCALVALQCGRIGGDDFCVSRLSKRGNDLASNVFRRSVSNICLAGR